MDTKSDDDQVKAPVGKHVEMSRNSSRKVCWEKRDAYFACLDKNDNLSESCTPEKDEYYKICPGSWIKHFNKLRIQAIYKSGINQLRESGAKVPLAVMHDETEMSQKV